MSSLRSTQPANPQPQADEAPSSSSNTVGTVGERLARLRHALIGWLDLQAKEELRLLQTQGPSSAEAVEIEAYTLLLDLRNEPQQALLALQQKMAAPWQRLQFAHSDLAGYSVFEEAFGQGSRCGAAPGLL